MRNTRFYPNRFYPNLILFAIISTFFIYEAIQSRKDTIDSKIKEAFFYSLTTEEVYKIVIRRNHDQCNSIEFVEKELIEEFLNITKSFVETKPNHPLMTNLYIIEIFTSDLDEPIFLRISLRSPEDSLILSGFGNYTSKGIYGFISPYFSPRP